MEFLLKVKDLFKQDFQVSSQIDVAMTKTFEYRTTDYGTEEIQNKLIQESLSKEITKKSIINLQQLSIVTPIEETKDIQETSNQTEIKFTSSSSSANQTNKRKKQDSEV
ncbi:40007_t:CDS:2 [Gigaspora margarita]|uniref:40007_t:CDS:1 n=1 Tax=Gigaspora margarita TaxID=4874 RepID=A0ABN7WBC4_GIGMA|nr:40007_t:CDS:2 [Gigaspora margarita]